jgi:hypothetical protein
MSGGKPGMFKEVEKENGAAALQVKIIGPDYDYISKTKSTTEMGMSPEGNWSQLGRNISGLLGYIQHMVVGDCAGLGTCASTTGKPLGSKFFVDTPLKCTNKETREKVKRSLYINNVPDGSIPFLSSMTGITFPTFQGLLPGLMSNASQLNPMQILLAFVSTPGSTCQPITMETIDANDKKDRETAYVLNKDIETMNPAWFNLPGHPKPSKEQLKEIEPKEREERDGFRSINSSSSITDSNTLNGAQIDYSKMPDDILIKFYYSCLGLLCLYLLFKILMKKNRK